MALPPHAPTPGTPEPGRRSAARALTIDVIAVALLAAASVGIAFVEPIGHVDVVAFVAGVALYAAAWLIHFSVGSGSATPLQLVFVPMWFLLAPALLPAVAVGGQLTARVVAGRIAHAAPRWGEAWSAAADGWHGAAPALILALVGVLPAAMYQWPLVAAGVLAQLALHSAAAGLRRLAKGEPRLPRRRTPVLAANVVIELSVAALGLELAIVASESILALVLVVPFMALLSHFAREREHRIEHARTLAAAYRGTAALMGDVLEADDAYTGGEHTQGVVEMSVGVGKALGLGAVSMRNLEFGALLHDIGKLRVPNSIINKPGRLTAEEWEIIKQHPAHGEAMLVRVGGALAEVAPIVRGHHERFDGAGYPDGLAGDAIPIEARIITLCDSFSAMTTNRSYRTAMSHQEAIAEVWRCTPGQFDPAVVDALFVSLDGDHLDELHVAAPSHPAYGEAGSVAGESPAPALRPHGDASSNAA